MGLPRRYGPSFAERVGRPLRRPSLAAVGLSVRLSAQFFSSIDELFALIESVDWRCAARSARAFCFSIAKSFDGRALRAHSAQP